MASLFDPQQRIFLLISVLLVCTGSLVLCSASDNIVLDLGPSSGIDRIRKYVPATLNVTLRYNGSDPEVFAESNNDYVLTLSLSNTYTATFMNLSLLFTNQDVLEQVVKPVEVVGQVIGYVMVAFKLHNATDDPETSEGIVLRENYMVSVIPETNIWDNIFTIVMAGLAMINTINMGCCLDLGLVKKTLMRPIGPIVGFLSQFTFMPLFSFMLAYFFLDNNLFKLGLFVMGVCPGGAASNIWTILLDGDVNLSITMTFISTVAALGMMPLWIWLLAGYFLDGQTVVKIPFMDLVISLITLTVPLAIGLIIRWWRKPVADFLAQKFIKPFSFAICFFTFGLGFYSLSHIFVLITWKMIVSGLSVAVAGFVFGAALAWIARLRRPQIIAISLETAMQNGTIAYVLLKISMPAPFCDLAALPPIAQILMTTSILFGCLGMKKLIDCVSDKCCTSSNDQVKTKTIPADETVEAVRPLMNQGLPDITAKRDIAYYGGEVPREFIWVKRASLLVPSSPTSDPRSNF